MATITVRDARVAPLEPRPLRVAAMAADAVPVTVGELEVVASVDVEFALEQA